MNWGKITACAATLFAAQVAIGFFEVAFAPSGISTLIVSGVVSFTVCGIIFARLSASQPFKPFAHAVAAPSLQIVVAVAFSQALAPWLGSLPMTTVALEWLVLACVLLAGTCLGLSLRRARGRPADA